MDNKIYNIDQKLADMRIRYKIASPAMKNWLEAGAKLLHIEKDRLIKTQENENQTTIL